MSVRAFDRQGNESSCLHEGKETQGSEISQAETLKETILPHRFLSLKSWRRQTADSGSLL